MNKQKKVCLTFSGAKAIIFEKGTEIVKNLPDSFEIRAQTFGNFRCNVRLMRLKDDVFTADIYVEYNEDIQQWRD